MSSKVVLRQVASSNRRQPLLQQNKSSLRASTRLGEAVGGTAAVCCCAPCAVANIVYLAIYKVPATLCLRALRKRKQRHRRRIQASGEGMFPAKRRCTCGCCDDVVGARVHACESNGLQYMDSTMWMHHPRTEKMFQFISDPNLFGSLQSVHATFSYPVSPDFLAKDIRVKPDLDALGTLGDTGWYCIRAILWAANYELPKTAKALHKPKYNEAGVILSCEASLIWEDNKVATFFCSFLSDMNMDITAIGAKGSLRVHDYVIPNEENEALFRTSSNSYFVELSTGWNPKPSEVIVKNDIPQEALMVKEFAHLVGGIKYGNSKADNKWAIISRKTQVVIDAVKASIDNGLLPVPIEY